jgi:hypothetical protein
VPIEVANYINSKQRMEKHAMKMINHGGGRSFAELPPQEALTQVLYTFREQQRHALNLLEHIEKFVSEHAHGKTD